jgi:hypothetical protein
MLADVLLLGGFLLRAAADRIRMGEDRADRGWLGEERDQAHLALAARAGERREPVAP